MLRSTNAPVNRFLKCYIPRGFSEQQADLAEVFDASESLLPSLFQNPLDRNRAKAGHFEEVPLRRAIDVYWKCLRMPRRPGLFRVRGQGEIIVVLEDDIR